MIRLQWGSTGNGWMSTYGDLTFHVWMYPPKAPLIRGAVICGLNDEVFVGYYQDRKTARAMLELLLNMGAFERRDDS